MGMINISLLIIILISSAIIFSLFRYSYEYVREEIRQGRLTQKRNYKRLIRAFRTPFVLFFIPLLGFLIVDNIPPPDLNDPYEKIDYNRKYDNQLEVLEGYVTLIKREPSNPKWHYHFFRQVDNSKLLSDLPQQLNFPYRFYYDSLFSVEGYHDIAALGMGLEEFVVEKNNERALEFLFLVKDSTLPYVNYTIANIYFNEGKVQQGIHYHEKEVAIKGYVKGSLYSLSDYYLTHKKYEKAHELVKLDPYLQYLPLSQMRDEVFIPQGDFKYYVLSYIMRHVRQFSLFGFLGSLFVLVGWIFYLQKLDIFSSIPLSKQLLAVLLGMFFIFFVYPLSDIIDYYLNDFFIKDKWHFFLMCVVRIGMVEELVKLIPLLLIMKFTKWLKDPYDYIFYACSSALGFAFLENLIYAASYGTHIISSRAMIAVVMHMMCSSVIAYAIILARYKKTGNLIGNLLLGFLIASVVHGFYDFWLITRMFTIISYFIFAVTIINWRKIINNAINNSRYFDVEKIKHFTNLEFYLVTLLIGILTVEYVLNGLEKDARTANEVLAGNFIKNGYLTLYLALSIGKVDLFPGYWQKLGFPKNISALIIPKGINPLNFIGYEVKMRFSKKNNTMPYLTVATGKIVRRLILSEEKDWFMIQLDKPIVYEGGFYYQLMINFKTPEVKLEENTGVRATIRLPLKTLNEQEIEFPKKTTLWVGHCLVQKMP